MIKILLFFSLLEMIFSLDWRFYLNQRSSSIKMEDIWVEINNNVITFDRYCIFGVARKSRIDWCLGAREQERERERDGRVCIVYAYINSVYSTRASTCSAGRGKPIREIGFCSSASIEDDYSGDFAFFFFFPSLSLVHGRCSSASRGSHDKSFLSN